MKYYTDGYTLERNPSKIGGGYSVVDENGALIRHKVIHKEGFTNNEGEILGIRKALELCEKGDCISTDSMVALTWIRKGKSKARPDLTGVLHYCNNLVTEKKVNLMWEGREYNLAGHFNEDYDSGSYATLELTLNQDETAR